MAGVMNEVDPLAENTQGAFPSTQDEKEMIVEQIVTMIRSKEVIASVKKQMMNSDSTKVMNVIATLAANIGSKMVMEIEGQTGRDIAPKAELGMVAIASEELVTIAQQFGLKPDKEMVANIVQISANEYNKMMQGRG